MGNIRKSNSRRSALKKIAVTTAATLAGNSMLTKLSAAKPETDEQLKGRINHSVCPLVLLINGLWKSCALKQKKIGIKAIDLVGPKDWPTLKKYDLDSSMCNGAELGIAKGWNDKQYHDTLIKNYTEMIPLVAQAGYKNLICLRRKTVMEGMMKPDYKTV